MLGLGPRTSLWQLTIALFALSVGAFAREVVPLDVDWAFHRGDVADAAETHFAPSGWARVDLPHDWSIGLPIDATAAAGGAGGFFVTGIGWYRRAFMASAAWRDDRVTLEFDGVYMNAEVWLNGVRLGTHAYGYTPFRFDLTPYLAFDAPNIIAVRVDNSAEPNSRWYSGSGIYRHVRLVVAAPVHVADDGIFVRTTELGPASATVRVVTRIRDDETLNPSGETRGANAATRIELETVVVDAAGRPIATRGGTCDVRPGAEGEVDQTIAIPRPQPWSPETPVLYRAVTTLRRDGCIVDEVETPFGIRRIDVTAARGFTLNGRAVKLIGANVHADNGPLGAAAFDRADQRRVELLKAAGFNAVRTAHNPPSVAFLDACDRLGLFVLEEAFDGWEKGKNPHDYSVYFKAHWRDDLDAMVRRDRNHPSVVLWSIGNEMFERGNARGLRIAQDLTGRIRELDPSRPITAGVNGPGKNGDWSKLDPLFATLDVAGYNYELERHEADHARLPQRTILVTESYQSETAANWEVIQKTPYVIGDFVWSGLDYLGEAGIGRVFLPGEPIVKHWEGNQFPWHGAACGDIDLTGWRKPISHYRAIVWDRGERLYTSVAVPVPKAGKPIATSSESVNPSATDGWGVSPWTVRPSLPSWTWPGREGEMLTVEVDSRYDSVRLYLNERLLGEKPTTAQQDFRTEFAVPYAPGILRAAGVHAGREVEDFLLQTVDAPAGIRLTADRAQIAVGAEDLSFVTVEMVDRAGRWVPAADTMIKFSIDGAGTIAAIGNADLTSIESYQANPHRVYQGRALVVIRSAFERGRITLTASALGVTDGKALLEVR